MCPTLDPHGYFKHGEETEWRFILYQGGICKRHEDYVQELSKIQWRK